MQQVLEDSKTTTQTPKETLRELVRKKKAIIAAALKGSDEADVTVASSTVDSEVSASPSVPKFPHSKIDDLLAKDMTLFKDGTTAPSEHSSGASAPPASAEALKKANKLRQQIRLAFQESPETQEVTLAKKRNAQRTEESDSVETDAPKKRKKERKKPKQASSAPRVPCGHMKLLNLKIQNRRRKMALCGDADGQCMARHSRTLTRLRRQLKRLKNLCRPKESPCSKKGYRRWVRRQRLLIQTRMKRCLHVDSNCVNRAYLKLRKLRFDGPKLYLTYCPNLGFLQRVVANQTHLSNSNSRRSSAAIRSQSSTFLIVIALIILVFSL